MKKSAFADFFSYEVITVGKKKTKTSTASTNQQKFTLKQNLKVNVGGRFIFFSELLNSENPSLKGLGTAAQNKLTMINSTLKGTGNENVKSSAQNNIEKYLKFIIDAAKSRYDNEIDFLKRQLADRIMKLPESKNTDELKKMLNSLNESIIDYDQILYLFNYILQDHTTFRDTLDKQINNIKLIQDNYNDLTKEDQQKIIEDFDKSYGAYLEHRKELTQKRFIQADETGREIYHRMQTTITELYQQRIERAIENLANNPTLIAEIESEYSKSSGQSVDENTLLKILVDIVTREILQGGSASTFSQKELSDTITLPQLEKIIDNNIIGVFQKGIPKTLEEIAMRYQNRFEGITNFLLSLKDTDAVIEEYAPNKKEADRLKDALAELQKETQESRKKYLMGVFTRDFGSIIQKQILDKLNITKSQVANIAWNEIRDKAKEYAQVRPSKNTVADTLRITRLKKASSVAELIGNKEVQDQIINVINNNIPGAIINLKDDIVFTVGFDPAAITSHTENFEQDFNKTISLMYKDFLSIYHSRGGGKTNISTAKDVYKEQLGKIIEKIKTSLNVIDKDDKDMEKILKELKDFFLGAVSIKDYNVYSNELGFHGGSLGQGGSPEGVMQNVYAMYEMGGITALDAETLYFAAVNCASSTLGPSDLKTNLENYVLGAAALMMFDESFSSSESFLQDMQEQLINSHIKNLELYRLNGVYVPSSYILNSIAENLSTVYQQIAEMDTPLEFAQHAQNRVAIIPHSLTPDDIPKKGTSQERWNWVAEQGNANTKINFIFMAGMLDIMEQLQAAFQVE